MFDVVIHIGAHVLVHEGAKWIRKEYNKAFHAGLDEYEVNVEVRQHVVATYTVYAKSEADLKKACQQIADTNPNYTRITQAKVSSGK